MQALGSAPPGTTGVPQPTRHEIDLGGLLAFEIRQLITPAEADALIAAGACRCCRRASM